MRGVPLSRRGLVRIGAAAVLLPALVRSALAQAAQDAADTVSRFCDALLQAMRAGQAGVPFAQRAAALGAAVDRAFDLDTILQVSVGPQWSALPPDQQATLRDAFRRYTVANFAANFDSFSGQTILVNPEPRRLPNGDEIVTTSIGKPGETPVTLAYVMRQGPSGWRAVDVLVNGNISRVATQRSDFRSLLLSGGAPALVSSLQSKAAGLAG